MVINNDNVKCIHVVVEMFVHLWKRMIVSHLSTHSVVKVVKEMLTWLTCQKPRQPVPSTETSLRVVNKTDLMLPSNGNCGKSKHMGERDDAQNISQSCDFIIYLMSMNIQSCHSRAGDQGFHPANSE